jgi:hypothetical protein
MFATPALTHPLDGSVTLSCGSVESALEIFRPVKNGLHLGLN